MTDIVLNPVLNTSNLSSLNDNFDKIEASLNEDVIKKSGGSNIMSQDFDMNGHALINSNNMYTKGAIPNPVNVGDAVNLGTLEDRLSDITGVSSQVQVTSVNGKVGEVDLTASDVGAATASQGALASTAVQPSNLSAVATSGLYVDLSGQPTLSTVATSGNYNDLSNKPIPVDNTIILINNQSGTSYTLALTDAGKDILCTNVSAITLTIPPSSSVAFPIGTWLLFSQGSTGVVTATASEGVTLNAANGKATTVQFDVRGLEKVGTDTWRVL